MFPDENKNQMENDDPLRVAIVFYCVTVLCILLCSLLWYMKHY